MIKHIPRISSKPVKVAFAPLASCDGYEWLHRSKWLPKYLSLCNENKKNQKKTWNSDTWFLLPIITKEKSNSRKMWTTLGASRTCLINFFSSFTFFFIFLVNKNQPKLPVSLQTKNSITVVEFLIHNMLSCLIKTGKCLHIRMNEFNKQQEHKLWYFNADCHGYILSCYYNLKFMKCVITRNCLFIDKNQCSSMAISF